MKLFKTRKGNEFALDIQIIQHLGVNTEYYPRFEILTDYGEIKLDETTDIDEEKAEEVANGDWRYFDSYIKIDIYDKVDAFFDAR